MQRIPYFILEGFCEDKKTTTTFCRDRPEQLKKYNAVKLDKLTFKF